MNLVKREAAAVSRRAAIAAAAAATAAVAGLALAAGAAEAQERYPRLQAAIQALQVARDDILSAHHDFGGHRDAAVRACDQAMTQLRLAMRF